MTQNSNRNSVEGVLKITAGIASVWLITQLVLPKRPDAQPAHGCEEYRRTHLTTWCMAADCQRCRRLGR